MGIVLLIAFWFFDLRLFELLVYWFLISRLFVSWLDYNWLTCLYGLLIIVILRLGLFVVFVLVCHRFTCLCLLFWLILDVFVCFCFTWIWLFTDLFGCLIGICLIFSMLLVLLCLRLFDMCLDRLFFVLIFGVVFVFIWFWFIYFDWICELFNKMFYVFCFDCLMIYFGYFCCLMVGLCF